jgi:putative thioredoxin
MTNAPSASSPISGASIRGAVDLSSLVRSAQAPVGAAPSAPVGSVPSLVVAATDSTFSAILELSSSVPVIVEFYAPGLEPQLGSLIESFGGRLVLATVDGSTNPQLAQAFQVREVPAVAAVIAGRPAQLFVGMPTPDEVRPILEQVLELAAEEGVSGSVSVAAGDVSAEAEPVEEPLPPLHQEAYDAIDAGDYALAVQKYQTAILQNPRDALAVAGLAQVSLLQRLTGADSSALRDAAAAAPKSVAAQLAVADLDVSGGHLEDAFLRLLELFPTLDADGKNLVRTRMLEYFEVAGADDPRVVSARRQLTNLLY